VVSANVVNFLILFKVVIWINNPFKNLNISMINSMRELLRCLLIMMIYLVPNFFIHDQ